MEFACPQASRIIRIDSSYRETRPTPCVNFTMSYREYLGLPSTCYFFRSTYKHWYGKQLFAKTFWMHSKNLLESLNFVALMKPNKHKMRLEHFSTTWPNLFLNTFATVWVSRVADLFFFFHSGVQIKKKNIFIFKFTGCAWTEAASGKKKLRIEK